MVKYRSGRINEEMKKEISYIIQNKIRDPRLNVMVSVTKVDVTKDLKYAKVYVSIFGDENAKKEAFDILKKSAGFIRREVSHTVNLRCTPELIIELDDSIENGMHIDALLDKIKETAKNDNQPDNK